MGTERRALVEFPLERAGMEGEIHGSKCKTTGRKKTKWMPRSGLARGISCISVIDWPLARSFYPDGPLLLRPIGPWPFSDLAWSLGLDCASLGILWAWVSVGPSMAIPDQSPSFSISAPSWALPWGSLGPWGAPSSVIPLISSSISSYFLHIHTVMRQRA